MPASGLPESIKERYRRLYEQGSRVDPALGNGKKWSFEMNTQRHRAIGRRFPLDRVSNLIQGA
jgi:hypothetical protein